MKNSSGFTLIEVLVALAIFAVAVASLSAAMQNNVKNANYLKDKTIAHWIASNKMVELAAAGDYPAIADRTDKIEYAGQEWVVNTKIQKAQTKMAIRIGEVSVGMEKEGDANYYATLTALFSEAK
ncbi:MAG: type II secretion system minor pseudopilin GspI [Ketobacter sp.]